MVEVLVGTVEVLVGHSLHMEETRCDGFGRLVRDFVEFGTPRVCLRGTVVVLVIVLSAYLWQDP